MISRYMKIKDKIKGIRVCEYCIKRFECGELSKKCELCGNNIEPFIKSINENLKRVNKEVNKEIKQGKSFSLSSNIPTEYNNKDEYALNFCKGESLKSYLNKAIKESSEKKLGLVYSPENADIRIRVDFPSANISFEAEDLFIYGAYKKLKPGISQKRWKKYEHSVEELIGGYASHYLVSEEYIMHSSGREDVDAINTGFRPFVFQFKKAKLRARNEDIKTLEKRINELRRGVVEVKLYGRVERSFVTLLSDSHFDKEYKAYIKCEDCKESEEGFKESIKKAVVELKGRIITQKTPTRVLSRRVDKFRKRKIYDIKFGEDEKGIYIEVKSEAGLYIKELISGDSGRTKPNISSLTKRRLVCSFLIVKNINYSFLNKMFENARIKY